MSRSGGGGGSEGSSSGASGGSTGTGTAAQQADNMTRNMILGLPKEGLDPASPEAADLRAAEAFVSDIQQEIMAYDIANAKAMETYMRTWWSKVPVFGRHAKASLEAEQAAEAAEALAMAAAKEGSTSQHVSALDGLDAATAAAAASAAGGTYMHTQSQTLRGGGKVERTSALSEENLRELAKDSKGRATAKVVPPAKMNSWLFKRNHPGWVPLMQRWWVPWTCIACIALVWTPDVWKLRTLYYLDHQYALFRQTIHIAYWRMTLTPEDFDEVMQSVRAGKPSNVKGTDCPF